jgi:hypothetical protein
MQFLDISSNSQHKVNNASLKLPVSSELLKLEVVKSKQKELVERQKSQKCYYDKKSKPLPEVSPGEIVRFKKDIGLSNWEPAIGKSLSN